MNHPKLSLCALPGLILIEMNLFKKNVAMHNASIFATGVDSVTLKFGLALDLAFFFENIQKNKTVLNI